MALRWRPCRLASFSGCLPAGDCEVEILGRATPLARGKADLLFEAKSHRDRPCHAIRFPASGHSRSFFMRL